jgi:hypothetical protein
MQTAARAAILLVGGALLRDCLLLAAGVMLLGLHQHQRLDECPDRAHAWLRCVLGGAWLFVAGALLMAHTTAVVLGWWPSVRHWDPLVSAALALSVAVGGLSTAQVTWRHGLLAAGVLAAVLSRRDWAACALAASVAVLALVDALRRLGPMSKALAARHDAQ